jgi:outer membrane protein assembly factor BamD (BamD/ComL family)
MNKPFSIVLITLLLLLITGNTRAQQTAVYDDPAAAYNTGLSLFNQELYGQASEAFSDMDSGEEIQDDLMQVNADY